MPDMLDDPTDMTPPQRRHPQPPGGRAFWAASLPGNGRIPPPPRRKNAC